MKLHTGSSKVCTRVSAVIEAEAPLLEPGKILVIDKCVAVAGVPQANAFHGEEGEGGGASRRRHSRGIWQVAPFDPRIFRSIPQGLVCRARCGPPQALWMTPRRPELPADGNDAASMSVYGGPYDGAVFQSHHSRVWVAAERSSRLEKLLPGDEHFGAFLYDLMRLPQPISPLGAIRGCYHRTGPRRGRWDYLDLLNGEGTGARRYLDLALFLPAASMLLRSNDWQTRRPDSAFAQRVLEGWHHDPSVAALCTRYLAMLLLDELGD